MTNMYGARNNVSTTVAPGGYTAASGSLAVVDGSGFRYTDGSTPTSTKPIVVSTFLANSTPKGVYRCEGVSGNTLTLTALLSGTDSNLSAGDVVEMRMCAEHIGQVASAVNANETAIAALQADDATTVHSAAPPTKGNVLVGTGTAWVALGVGTDGQVLAADSTQATGAKWATPAASGGTVTSVGLSMPGVIFNATVPGSPVTTSGTFAPTLANQTAKTFLAGPTSGAAATPTFRAIALADEVAGGADTQLQFNDGGLLAGAPQMTYSKTTGLLTMTNIVQNNNLILANTFGDYANSKGYISTNTSGIVWNFNNRATSNVQIVVNAITGQTVDQLQLKNSAGAVNYAFDKLNRPYTGGNAPTVAAGAGAGTAPTVSISGTDVSGTITITTGTSPTAGAIVATVTFSAAFAAIPKNVTITPVGPNSAAALLTAPWYEDQASRSTTAFVVKTAGGTGLAASTTFLLSYSVDG